MYDCDLIICFFLLLLLLLIVVIILMYCFIYSFSSCSVQVIGLSLSQTLDDLALLYLATLQATAVSLKLYFILTHYTRVQPTGLFICFLFAIFAAWFMIIACHSLAPDTSWMHWEKQDMTSQPCSYVEGSVRTLCSSRCTPTSRVSTSSHWVNKLSKPDHQITQHCRCSDFWSVRKLRLISFISLSLCVCVMCRFADRPACRERGRVGRRCCSRGLRITRLHLHSGIIKAQLWSLNVRK